MKMKETIPHGEEGHIHSPECDGYAEGGVVKKQPWTLGRLFGEKPAELDAQGKRLPGPGEVVRQRLTQKMNPGSLAGESAFDARTKSGNFALPGVEGLILESLRNGAGQIAGAKEDALKNNRGLTAGTEGLEHLSSGGMVGAQEEKDPSIIPEHIKEFVENAHKERRESRPDENWRIKPAEKPESVAPYKRDEDELAKKPSVLERLKGMGLPKMAEGGEVPEPMADDPEMAPQPAAPAPVTAPPAAAPTDEDYMNHANRLMGLNPAQQAGFMKLLGDNAQKSQIGAGIAGIGDAIASGGTLGKVNPGALKASEEIGQNATKQGIEGMQTLRANNKENFEMGQTLRGNDPFAPEIQKSLVKQFHIPPALSGAPRDVIYKMLDPIAQTQLKEAELALNNSYRKESLDLQKQTLAATTANQKAERDIARKGQQLAATEKLGSRTMGNKIEGLIPGTSANTERKSLESIASGEKGPVPVNSRAEYDALASGTHYVDSHGTEKIKK